MLVRLYHPQHRLVLTIACDFFFSVTCLVGCFCLCPRDVLRILEGVPALPPFSSPRRQAAATASPNLGGRAVRWNVVPESDRAGGGGGGGGGGSSDGGVVGGDSGAAGVELGSFE